MKKIWGGGTVKLAGGPISCSSSADYPHASVYIPGLRNGQGAPGKTLRAVCDLQIVTFENIEYESLRGFLSLSDQQ